MPDVHKARFTAAATRFDELTSIPEPGDLEAYTCLPLVSWAMAVVLMSIKEP